MVNLYTLTWAEFSLSALGEVFDDTIRDFESLTWCWCRQLDPEGGHITLLWSTHIHSEDLWDPGPKQTKYTFPPNVYLTSFLCWLLYRSSGGFKWAVLLPWTSLTLSHFLLPSLPLGFVHHQGLGCPDFIDFSSFLCCHLVIWWTLDMWWLFTVQTGIYSVIKSVACLYGSMDTPLYSRFPVRAVNVHLLGILCHAVHT